MQHSMIELINETHPSYLPHLYLSEYRPILLRLRYIEDRLLARREPRIRDERFISSSRKARK